MKQLVINGNKELTGEIKISGAKNSVVALIPAAILSDEEVTLYNVPNISDTNALIDIIKLLNGQVSYENETMKIDTSKIENKLNGLNLMLLLIESIRKYNILEYNIKDTFTQFNIIEVLKHIDLNSTNPNIIDKTNIILSYITSL
jgi:hypothetical protein